VSLVICRFPAHGNPHGSHHSLVEADQDAPDNPLVEIGFALLEHPSVRAAYKRISKNLMPSADDDEALRALGRKQ
jgi:hypothetical protein